MTAAGNLSYTILDLDLEDAVASTLRQPDRQTMLGRLVSRFGVRTGGDVPWRSIWLASSKDGKFKNSTIEWFSENVEAGDSIEIPYAGDEWDWRNIMVKASSLGELCDQDRKKRDPLRIGGPALTPSLVYFHIANEAYRRLYTSRLEGGARRNLDLMPESLRFEKGDALFLPYPIRRQGAVVSATPSNGATPSATAALAPPWVIQFHDLLNTIGAKSVELATLNRICLTYDHEGSQAWAHIAVLHKLVNLQQRDALEFQQNNLAKLADLFVTLDDRTRDMLYVHGAETVAPDAYHRRITLANELRALMSMDRSSTRDGELSRQDLEANLRKFPRERINHDELLITMKDTILTRAFIAIAASPLAAYAEDTADRVIAELRSEREKLDKEQEGGSASGGAVASVVSTSVGNLPGPSSLAVAFVWIRSFRRVAEAARAAGDPTKTADVEGSFLGEIAAACGWGKEKAERFKGAAATTDAALTAEMAPLITEVEGKKEVISKAVSANFMVGRGWNLGIALVNMYVLYNTIATYDPNMPRKVVNVFGGVVMSGLSLIQFVSSCARGGAVAALLKTVGDKCSIVAILVSMVSGVVTLVVNEGNARIAGGLQVLSGGASLGGFAALAGGFTGVGLFFVVAGGVLMVASVGVANLDEVKRHWGPGPKVVIREQLGIFLKSFSIVQQVDRENVVLKPLVNEILALIEPDDASGLHDIDNSKSSIIDELRELPFARADIDLMTYTPSLKSADYLY